jgi:hypothetical protein
MTEAILTTYRTIRPAHVYLTPDSAAWYVLDEDSVIQCAPAAEPGWLRWERDGHVEGYVKAADAEECGR